MTQTQVPINEAKKKEMTEVYPSELLHNRPN